MTPIILRLASVHSMWLVSMVVQILWTYFWKLGQIFIKLLRYSVKISTFKVNAAAPYLEALKNWFNITTQYFCHLPPHTLYTCAILDFQSLSRPFSCNYDHWFAITIALHQETLGIKQDITLVYMSAYRMVQVLYQKLLRMDTFRLSRGYWRLGPMSTTRPRWTTSYSWTSNQIIHKTHTIYATIYFFFS